MKIMFLYSCDDTQSVSRPLSSWSFVPFGISYISSVLLNNGHRTGLVVLGGDNPWSLNLKLLRKHIQEFSPNLVCFTAVASQYLLIKQVAEYIKTVWPDIYLIIGGVHATLNPDEVIMASFDALCIGEGEFPLTELCLQLESRTPPHGIANLWIKSADGSIEKNEPRPFSQDLDSLPFPDRTMWSLWLKERPESELSLLLGRGCPYGCTYCSNHALKRVAPGKYVRFRSPENVINELASLHNTYPTHSKIYFEVESIALDKKWLLDFCSKLELYNSSINNFYSYACNFRISPQSIDENIFSALKKANFIRINIGLESGSERIRREILNRNYSNKDFLDVTALARKVGLKVFVYNIIGLPGETYQDYLDTVALNRQCQPDEHYTSIFYPYPGTELYDLCKRDGLINTPIDHRLERKRSVIDFPLFSKSEIQNAFTWFHYKVYKGYKPLWWVLLRTAITKIHGNRTLNLLYRRIVQVPVLNYIRDRLTSC